MHPFLLSLLFGRECFLNDNSSLLKRSDDPNSTLPVCDTATWSPSPSQTDTATKNATSTNYSSSSPALSSDTIVIVVVSVLVGIILLCWWRWCVKNKDKQVEPEVEEVPVVASTFSMENFMQHESVSHSHSLSECTMPTRPSFNSLPPQQSARNESHYYYSRPS